MFELERALIDERIPVDQFLRLIKKHARQEFLNIALAGEIVEAIAKDRSKRH